MKTNPSSSFLNLRLRWRGLALAGALLAATSIGSFEAAYISGVSATADMGSGFDEADAPTEPVTTLVALKGNAVPGEPVGTIYNGFGTPAFDGTDVNFLAKIKGPDGSKKAIVRGTPQAVVLRTGDAAPDAGMATFKAFKDPAFAGGNYAVIAGITATDGSITKDNDVGIWSNATGPLHAVAREGGIAPGAGDAVFKTFLSLALPPPAVVAAVVGNGIGGARGAVFVAKLATAVAGVSLVDSSNDIGLWRETATAAPGLANVTSVGTAELLLREGQTLDVGDGMTPDVRTVTTFTCIKSVSGSPGHGRSIGDGEINVRVAFDDGTQAILQFYANDPGYFVMLKTGDTVTGSIGNEPTFKKFGVPGFFAGSGGYTFLASLKTGVGGITSANDTAIFDTETGFSPGYPVVSESDLAVGAGANYFYRFKDPTTSSENIAFLGSLKKNALTGVDSNNDYGLWKGFTGGSFNPLTLVAREGSEGFGIAGSAIKSFVSQALPDLNGGPLYTAKLVIGTGGITSADAFALWANQGTDADRTFLLAQQGHPLVASATSYGVRTVTILKSVSGSPGQPRAYNETGGVTYKAKLDTGLEGIFRVQLPAPPGPVFRNAPSGKAAAKH